MPRKMSQLAIEQASKSEPKVEPKPEVKPVSQAQVVIEPIRQPRKRGKLNRAEYTFCIFIGSSNAPKLWAKTADEVKVMLEKLPKIENVTVARLYPVTMTVHYPALG